MNKQNLKVDDYYYVEYSDTTMPGFCIVKGTQNINRPNLYTANKQFYMKNNCRAYQNIRLTTPEEKHWLDKCIELNKFITKEEAMKSFIPEYVKGILKYSNEPINKIYNTKVDPTFTTMLTWKRILIDFKRLGEYFIPSTKEEFEAQNKPKETIQKVTTTIDKLTYTGNIDIPKGTTFEVIEEFENSYQVLKLTGYDIQGKYLFLHKSYFEPKEPEKELLVNSGLSQTKACQTCKYHNKCNKSPLLDLKGICPAKGGQHYAKEQEPTKEVIVKLDSRVYSLDEITKIINNNYEKEDALEIINTIKTIK